MKNTKRALLMSALSMLMCISMLIGSTFAWFTDSVTTGGNRIVAGNLKVDLLDKDGNSLKGQSLKWVVANSDGSTTLAEDSAILWEPGCTYQLQSFKVANKGDLALKYQVIVNGIKGGSKLLEVIDFTVKTGENEPVALKNFSGVLLAGEETETITITAHMDENAGNEYMGQSIENLSITVNAIQYTYENDSKDNQYDADAEFEIGSPARVEALVEAGYTEAKTSDALTDALASPDVEKIVLSDDVAVGNASGIVLNSDKTIDLNGNSLELAKFISPNEKTKLVVKNGNVSSGNNIFYNNKGGTITLENVNVETTSLSAHAVFAVNGTTNISGGSITAKGGSAVYTNKTSDGIVNITGTTMKSAMTDAVKVTGKSTVTIENCDICGGGKVDGKGNITRATAILTNGSDSKDSVVIVKNSNLSSVAEGYTAYIPAGTVTFENCTSDRAVVICGGNVTINGGTYTAEGFAAVAPYVWNEENTLTYVNGMPSGMGHMGDAILIIDRKTGYELSSVTIQNATFSTQFTDENGNTQTAYAIKYVDMAQKSEAEAITHAFENNTYNYKLADGTDPVMIIENGSIS